MISQTTVPKLETFRGELTVPATIDLTNCEREPIHIPGAIQPHGLLFALDAQTLRITHLSENTEDLIGIAARDLLGRSIEAAIGGENMVLLDAASRGDQIDDANPLTLNIAVPGGRLMVDAILHRSGAAILFEIEATDSSLAPTFHRFYHSVQSSVKQFDSARTVQQLCEVVVNEVRRITDFDRVMVYRFDVDWHGEVVAEARAPAMEPFLGLHFPASDIPRQARELFKRSSLRYIPDVAYRPARIIADAALEEPLDLSDAVLRSVSPVHLEYLQNMQVGATMTVSLLKNGELWGLLACHHRLAKLVPYQVRTACDLIGRTMSLHLGSEEEQEDIEYRMRLKSVQVSLLAALSKDPDIARTLVSAEPNVLALVGATSAAIRYGDACTLVGQTPSATDVAAIIEWLHATGSDEVFATDSLGLVAPAFAPLAHVASGLIALPLSRAQRNYVLWFRPEALVTVNWGGDPEKPVEGGPAGERLAPRKSFDIWRQTVRLHALPWKHEEVEAARELRQVVRSIVVERAEELERLNRELTRSNVELDSFAHVASHDLKEPLRGIHNYASYLIEDYGSLIDAAGREKLETLVRLSQRMDALIESHLQLSRIGQADLARVPTDLRTLFDEVLDTLGPRIKKSDAKVTFVSALPTLTVDPVGLREVFDNVLSNALKYCDGPPRIEIGVADRQPPAGERVSGAVTPAVEGPFVTIFVRDRGIGIREKHLNAIFAMFKRLHATSRYGGGTGAGLAIARKILARHHGHIWAESSYGSGTTFYLSLPVGA